MQSSSGRPHFGPTKIEFPTSLAHKIVTYKAGQVVFSAGDSTNHVFYIRKGVVKLSVASAQGKEAVIAVLGESNFIGEDGLAGQPFRLYSATTTLPCTLLRIQRLYLMRLLRQDLPFSNRFASYWISRTLRVQDDLADRLLNSIEKRLARVLLLLAHDVAENKSTFPLPKINQATIAGMVSTTRSRVSTIMNEFKKMGFIEYHDGLYVHSSLLKFVLSE
jgi:CRP/FNR family transcriptional regulator, cyclic AMP receptor protein